MFFKNQKQWYSCAKVIFRVSCLFTSTTTKDIVCSLSVRRMCFPVSFDGLLFPCLDLIRKTRWAKLASDPNLASIAGKTESTSCWRPGRTQSHRRKQKQSQCQNNLTYAGTQAQQDEATATALSTWPRHNMAKPSKELVDCQVHSWFKSFSLIS
jgi:hypothetical protein